MDDIGIDDKSATDKRKILAKNAVNSDQMEGGEKEEEGKEQKLSRT